MRNLSGMGRLSLLLLQVQVWMLLISFSTAEVVSSGRPDADNSPGSTGGGTPRQHFVATAEADLENGPQHINDTNFKTLVHHCLQSGDATACNGMKDWDVSRVTDCSLLFWEPTGDVNNDWVLLRGADTFNVDISAWNTSSCTTMKSMFNGAVAFDQDIGNWDVRRVTDMSHMFQGARMFQKDISRWKTGNVLDTSHMFRYATRFHANDLSHWDTSRVTNMAFMFASASHFNGRIHWNVARVQHFQNMFHNADMFNAGGITEWDVGGAVDMPEQESYGFVSMFDGAKDFNQDISHWDMRHALTLDFMFREAYAFDQDISPWDIGQVNSMQDMFHHAKSFRQTLCWDVIGKTIGDLFDGTDSGKADPDTPKCWEDKHKQNEESNNSDNGNNFGTLSSAEEQEQQPPSQQQPQQGTVNSVTVTRTKSAPSMGTRFLQALLFAAVVALGSYWVVLIRRYMKTQNKRRNLEERVAGRSARRSSTEGNDGSSRSTDSGRGENTNHHMMNTSQCKFNIREQDDDLNYSSESEDDEEEIMFQKPEDIEALRQQCFTQSFDPTLLFGPEEEMEAMSAADHAVPAMNVLLQQETFLRQLREARKAKRAAASAAGFQYSPQNRQLLEALGTTATKLQSSSFDSSTQRQTIDNGYFPTQQHAAAMMNSRQVGTGSGTAGDALDALMQTSMNQAATSEKALQTLGGNTDYAQQNSLQTARVNPSKRAGGSISLDEWVFQDVESTEIETTFVASTQPITTKEDADVALRRTDGVDFV